MHGSRIGLRACLFLFAAVSFVAGPASRAFAQGAGGMPVPPGQIVTGPVYRGTAFGGSYCPAGSSTSCVGTSVPQVTIGQEANGYLLPKYSEPPFTPNASAFVSLTAAPTQWARFYNPAAGSNQAGGFIVGSNVVRGLTPAQIQAVLALSFTPTMETLVNVPAGTCLIIGPANPLFGQPGGGAQEFLIGVSQGGPGCGPVPQFIPSSSLFNAQLIGAYALFYEPRAGGGNAGAVAFALDHAAPPPLFTDMDAVYNALDVLNYGSPGPLRAALAQLGGEIYADAPSVAIAAGMMFLDTLRDQIHLSRGFASPTGGQAWRVWVSGLGGGGEFSGNGAGGHSVNFAGGGSAIGADRNLAPGLLAGFAGAYSHSGFGTTGISGDGGLDSFAVASYFGYAAGPWRLDGAFGYSYNSADVSRTIAFPGVWRTASGNLTDNAFLSRIEAGYRIRLNGRAAAAPFASFQGIVAGQNSFAENGAGAVNLNVDSVTDASALSVLGVEASYELPVGLAAPLCISARAGWAHDFADVNRGITANLEGALGSSFTVYGARWPQDAAAAGVRFSLLSQQTDLFIRYDGLFGDGAAINSATGGVRFAF